MVNNYLQHLQLYKGNEPLRLRGEEPLRLYGDTFGSGGASDGELLKTYASIGLLLKDKEIPVRNRENALNVLSAAITQNSDISVKESDIERLLNDNIIRIDGENAVLGERSNPFLDSLKYVWVELPQKIREFYVSKYRSSIHTRKRNTMKIRADPNIIARLLSTDKKYVLQNELPYAQMISLEEEGAIKAKLSGLHIKSRTLPHPKPCEICSELVGKDKIIHRNRGKHIDKNDEVYGNALSRSAEWFKENNIELDAYNTFISRGENFWKAAADYLMKNDFREADLPINEKELGLIREHFEYFNNESSIGACPAGLPKEECEREWKTTDSVQYFAHADMGNGRFFLHNFIPGVFIKPLDENERKIVLPVEDFKHVVETAGEMDYDFGNNDTSYKISKKNSYKFSSLDKSRIKKRKENIIIDLSGIPDDDMKKERHIAWKDLKTVYERLQ